MKVVVLTNAGNSLYGFRKELLLALVSQGHNVWSVYPTEINDPRMYDIGCHIIDIPLKSRSMNLFSDLRLMWRYWKIIKEINPDVALTYTIKPNVYGGFVCRVQKVPHIANITGLGTAVENGGMLQTLTLSMYRAALKNARKVFFQNQENLDFFIQKNIARENYALIPGSGVNLTDFVPMPYPPDSETVNFLFVSRLLKEKGIDQYLDAAQVIKTEYPGATFTVIGFHNPEYDRARLDELHRAGVIEYYGAQSDVKSYYEKAHCIVHPSYYPEGMSNVLQEAAACARPVISTDRSGCREVVDDGVNGYLARPRDSEDLADKIRRFLALTWEQKRDMGLAGRRLVEQKFDRQIVVDAYMREVEANRRAT